MTGPTETLAQNLEDCKDQIITTHFEHYKVEGTAVQRVTVKVMRNF